MNTTTIISGNFATSANNKGNFTAYNAKGTQIFIAKEMLAKIGITTNAEFESAKPLYAITDTRTFDPIDANGQPLPSFTRLQVVNLFANEDDLINAEVADDSLAIKTAIKRRQLLELATKNSGLTEESISAILTASSLV